MKGKNMVLTPAPMPLGQALRMALVEQEEIFRKTGMRIDALQDAIAGLNDAEVKGQEALSA